LLRVDQLQLEPVVENLLSLDWVGQLAEERVDASARLVLLADPDSTLLAPLFEALLLQHEPSTQNLWKNGLWPLLNIRSAL